MPNERPPTRYCCGSIFKRRDQVIVVDENAAAFKRLGPKFKGHEVVGTGIDYDVLKRAGAATALQFQLPAMGIAVPNALLIMMPYLLALLAVAGLVGRQTAPAALAEPYRRA